MTLRELPFGRFRMPSTRVFTHEEATDRQNDRWILEYARDRVRIQDVLAGRVQVMGFSKSSHLHLPIHLIFTFFLTRNRRITPDLSTGTRGWRRKRARTLFNVICAVKLNIDWRVGRKPPIDRFRFYKLMLCSELETVSRVLECEQAEKGKETYSTDSVLLRDCKYRRTGRIVAPDRT